MTPPPIGRNSLLGKSLTDEEFVAVSALRSEMSISVGRRQAVRTALWLLWTVVRHPRASYVDFSVWHDKA